MIYYFVFHVYNHFLTAHKSTMNILLDIIKPQQMSWHLAV